MSDRQFVIIPFRAIDDQALEDKHIRTLCILGGHTNKGGICKIRQSKIAEIQGRSRKFINENLGVLAGQGYIEKQHTIRADGGNGAIEYRMIFDTPPVTTAVTPPVTTAVTPPVTTAVTPPVTTAVTCRTSLTEYSNEGKDIPKGISKKTDLPMRIYECWNLTAEQFGLSKVRTELKNHERDKTILRRLSEVGDEAVLFEAIGNLTRNPFWIGKGEKPWRADFDWVFKSPSNFRKILEYKPAPQTPKAQNGKQRNQVTATDRIANAGAARREIWGEVLDECEDDRVSSPVRESARLCDSAAS